MNVLFLMGGEDRTNSHEDYPLPLIEIKNKPLIEYAVDSVRCLQPTKVIFALKEEHARKYHLTEVIKLLMPDGEIVEVKGPTKGSACTALLASESIDNDQPLLILGIDELIQQDYAAVIEKFAKSGSDAGTITFRSVHPRYSFVRIDEQDGSVQEAAQKRPISTHATASFYYFKKGSDFVEAAKRMILKDDSADGNYYLCPTFNELVLQDKRVTVFPIDPEQYLPMKSEAQLGHLRTVMEEK